MMPEGVVTLEQLANMARKSGEEIPYYLVYDGKILNYVMPPTFTIWRDEYPGRFLNYWHAYAYLLQMGEKKDG